MVLTDAQRAAAAQALADALSDQFGTPFVVLTSRPAADSNAPSAGDTRG